MERQARMLVQRYFALVCAAVAVAGFAGCGSSGAATTHSVTGKVTTEDGQPLKGGNIAFSGKFGATGSIGEDGSYTLSTFDQDDGAPDGEYTVSIQDADGQPMTISGDNKVTVKPGDNTFDFKVQKAAQ